MKEFSLTIIISLLISTFCCKIIAAERFVVIANAEVPKLMETVQDVGAFAEPIIPGSSSLILLSVIALNFNPQFAPFDMTSNLRVIAFADTLDKKNIPLLCGIAKFNKKRSLPKTIKIAKTKFFVKSIDGKAVVASSKNLLKHMKIIEQTEKSDSDIVINLFPDQYLKNYAGNIDYLRGTFDKEISKKDMGKYIPDNKVIEKLLSQCDKLQIKVNARKKNIDLNLVIDPLAGSELAAFLEKNKANTVSTNSIINMFKKISGNDSFNVTNGLNGLVTLILVKIFPKGSPEVFSKLCKITVSNDQSHLKFNIAITQEALKQTLIAAGVISAKQHNGS